MTTKCPTCGHPGYIPPPRRPKCLKHPNVEMFNLNDIFRDNPSDNPQWACPSCIVAAGFATETRKKLAEAKNAGDKVYGDYK